MPVVTRFRVNKGIHPYFNFEQLEIPTRCPHGQPHVEEPISNKVEGDNNWHNLLYSCENLIKMPFDTPRVEDNL